MKVDIKKFEQQAGEMLNMWQYFLLLKIFLWD